MADKPLIVGVDPGGTSGIAAINLEGEKELIESRREFPKSEIIKELIETGKPLVVACDTGKVPSTVDKIASSLGARRFSPEEDLESERKMELGRGGNTHEIDAYAAAVYAYNNLKRSIDKIQKESADSDLETKELAKSYFSP